jgi:hypothetical protein
LGTEQTVIIMMNRLSGLSLDVGRGIWIHSARLETACKAEWVLDGLTQ